MKIHPVRAELFLVDRWTDMKKLKVAFRNFENVPNNEGQLQIITNIIYCIQ